MRLFMLNIFREAGQNRATLIENQLRFSCLVKLLIKKDQ